jgi:polar amino acid transport system substrate-binding protein
MTLRSFRGIASAITVLAFIVVATPASAGEVLDRVVATGTIRMPDEGEWPPYSYTNADGIYTGFDVEVAEEIARRLGVKLEVVRNPDGSYILWEDQTHGNWNDAFDFVVGSMTPTAERDQYVDFPVIYYYALGALAVHKDNTTINTPADASGKRIGALKAANYEMYLRRQDFGIVGMPPIIYKIDDPVIVTYDEESQAFDALAKGDGVELDALVNYLPVIMALIKEGQPFKIIGQPLYRVPQSVAVLPGDPEFAALLTEIVEEMHEDGTLSALSIKWLDFDLTNE